MQAVDDVRVLVRKGRYDAVHTYLFLADIVGTLGAKLGGCRRIIVSRRALHDWRHGASKVEHWLELATNVVADELIANSRTVLEDVQRSERILPHHCGVIYNGIRPHDYRLASPGTHSGPIRLVNVGALAPRKGQEFAIRALALLGERGVEARLVVVGGGPDERMLAARAGELGVKDCVEFVGEQLDPRPYLEAADLFVFPSRQEGFSNALIEAMASGLPVVASDVGGNREALGSDGGMIVPAEDPTALADAIGALVQQRDNLTVIGRSNRQRVERLFSLEASAERLANWYLHGPQGLPQVGV